MNYLEICKETDRILASQGVILSVHTTGYQDMLVSYVSNAYVSIQNMRESWDFLHSSVQVQLTAGKNEYNTFDIFATSVDPVSEWSKNRFILTNSNGTKSILQYVPYEMYVLQDWTKEDKPKTYTVYPENNTLIFNTPDMAYTIDAHYHGKAQLLIENMDVPLMPSQYHNTIYFQAAADLAIKLGIIEVYQLFSVKANTSLRSLLKSQNPSKRMRARGIV